MRAAWRTADARLIEVFRENVRQHEPAGYRGLARSTVTEQLVGDSGTKPFEFWIMIQRFAVPRTRDRDRDRFTQRRARPGRQRNDAVSEEQSLVDVIGNENDG